MPTFMGFRIADDPQSVIARSQSPTGFIDDDVPLLEFMKFIESKNGIMKVNPNIGSSASEIRDFLNWAIGSKKPPYPPLVRKILCLKRAIIKNSISSVNTADNRRTGERRQLEEIEGMLRGDGATDLDDNAVCLTGGSTFVSLPAPSTPPSINPATAPTTTVTQQGKDCTTVVSCDTSALTELIREMSEKISRLSTTPISQVSPAQNASALTNIREELREIAEKLSVPSSTPLSDPGSVASQQLSDTHDKLNSQSALLNQLKEAIDTKCSPNTRFDQLKTNLDQRFSNLTSTLSQLVQSSATPNNDVLAAIAELKTQINSLPTTDALKESLSQGLSPQTSIDLKPTEEALTAILAKVEALPNPDPEHGEIKAKLDEILSKLSATGDQDELQQARNLISSLESEKSSLTARIGELGGNAAKLQDCEAKLKECNESLAALKTKVAELESGSTQDKQTIAQLKTDLENARKDTEAKLAARNAQYREELLLQNVEATNAIKEASNSAIAELTDEKDKLLEDLKKLAAEKKAVETQNADLQQQLAALSGTQNELAQARSTIEALTQEKDALTAQIAESDTAHTAALEQQKVECEASIRDLNEKIAALEHGKQDELAGLKAELNSVRKNSEAKLAARNADAATQLRAKNEEIARKNAEAANAIQEASNSAIAELTDEKDKLLEDLKTLAAEKKALESRLAAQSTAQEELVHARATLDTLKQEKDALTAQMADSNAAQKAALEQQKANCETSIQELNNKISELEQGKQAELNAARRNAEEKLAARNADLAEQLRAKNEMIARKNAEAANAIQEASNSAIAELTEEKDKLLEDLKTLAAEKKALESRLAAQSSAQEELVQARATLDALKQEKATLEQQMAESDAAQKAALEQQMAESNAAQKAALEQQKADCESSIQELNNKISELEQQKQTTASELNAARRNAESKLAARNADYASKLAAKNAEIQRQTAQIDSFKRLQSAANATKNTLSAEYSALYETVGKMKAERERLLGEKDADKAAIANLDERIRAMQAQYEDCERAKVQIDSALKQANAALAEANKKMSEAQKDVEEKLAKARAEFQKEKDKALRDRNLSWGSRLEKEVEKKVAEELSKKPATKPSLPVYKPVVTAPAKPPTRIVPVGKDTTLKTFDYVQLKNKFNDAITLMNQREPRPTAEIRKNLQSAFGDIVHSYMSDEGDSARGKSAYEKFRESLDKLYGSGYFPASQLNMAKHADLLNETQFREYISKLLDSIDNYVKPPSATRKARPAASTAKASSQTKEQTTVEPAFTYENDENVKYNVVKARRRTRKQKSNRKARGE